MTCASGWRSCQRVRFPATEEASILLPAAQLVVSEDNTSSDARLAGDDQLV